MNIFNYFKENSDAFEVKKDEPHQISEDALSKFDRLMGDDRLPTKPEKLPELELPEFPIPDTQNPQEKFERLFTSNIASKEKTQESEQHEPNSTYERNGDVYETDDTGKTYKKNGELLPNTEYTVNGTTYRTDKNGRKISCDAKPKYTEDGTRNPKEQQESGGEDRHEDDDGGHIIARILGGAEGFENLIAMRRTINRGDYKKMETEICEALKEGKDVSMHVELEYDGDSQRPSKIKVVYYIDSEKTEITFDNNENSTDLTDCLESAISEQDYENLQEEMQDMEADGHSVSITSVKVEYDSEGNPTKVFVGVLDETTGTKSYKEYTPKGGN